VSVWAVATCGVPAIVAALAGASLVVVAALLAAGSLAYGGYLLRHRDVLGSTRVRSDSGRRRPPGHVS
jgi:hypothetical protein